MDKSEVYRHIKTGNLYTRIMHGMDEATRREVVIYRCLRTGKTWVREASEFYDPARFDNLSNADSIFPEIAG